MSTNMQSDRKPTRRDELVSAGAQLFAEHGYHGVGVNDIGDFVGLTGPALYRHFASKQALLSAVFERVVDGILSQIREIVVSAADPSEALRSIVDHHVAFALDEGELLATWRSEMLNLPEGDRRKLRHAQRIYVEEWVSVVADLRPDLPDSQIRATVHAVIGLIQSTMDYSSALDKERLRGVLRGSALAALLADPPKPQARREGTFV